MFFRRRLIVLLMTVVLAAATLVATGRWVTTSSAAPTPAVDNAQIADLASNDQAISFQLRAPLPRLTGNQIDAAGLNAVVQTPGAPQLPYYSRLIVLPPEATIGVVVRSAGATAVAVEGPLAFNPSPKAVSTSGEFLDVASVDELGVDNRPDPAIYGTDAAYPAALYTVSEPLYYRDVRFVRLDLFPYAYNPQRGLLEVHAALDVAITFSGGELSQRRPLGGSEPLAAALADRFLNPEQLATWRSLPADFAPQATSFPIGVETYKIEVNEDGIYDVDYATLAAAGMDVDAVDPATFELMYQGQPVAYEFIGNPADGFDSGEAVRFYGWKFDGNRADDNFIGNNIFWLWAGGTPTALGSVSGSGSFPAATSFATSATAEENIIVYTSLTNEWDTFDNEPDLWWWFRLDQATPTKAYAFTVDLQDPAPGATEDALLTVEVLSARIIEVNGVEQEKVMSVALNNHPNVGVRTWEGKRDVNITTTVPATTLINGANTVVITSTTNISGAFPTTVDRSYLNRITVDYQRSFKAVNDSLLFTHPGSHVFNIDNFSSNVTADVILWDITNRTAPAAVTDGTFSFSGGPGNYTLTFASASSENVDFIATTTAAVRAPIAVSSYVAPDLDNGGAGADWVALTHVDFLAQANQLAAHRADPTFGGHTTAVIDVADVYNQYGYGFAYPQAIQGFLAHALANWATPVAYVTLVGDGNMNVSQNPTVVAAWWDPTEPNYVIPDLQWVDRFNGMAPTDHTYTTLVGPPGDLLPDLAIGRLAVQSDTEAQHVVDKIITYETNHISGANYAGWLDQVVFVSDDADSGGDFCALNIETGTHIPAYFEQHHLCLDNTTLSALQTEMRNRVNNGISILNYRGHGAITSWASPAIVSTSDMSVWDNAGLPVVILSLDCLDGEFSRPGMESLAETILGYADVDGAKGSAAHWSSSGLGYSWEHRILAAGFYDALFAHGLTAIGDSIVFAKTSYLLQGYDESESYTFTLQGDPAMQLFRPELSISKTTDVSGERFVGQTVDYVLTITNTGLFPAQVVVADLLPAGMSYVSHATSLFSSALLDDAPTIALYASNPATDAANTGLTYGATAVLTLTVRLDAAGSLINNATVTGGGLEIDASNNAATAPAILARYGLFMPGTLLNP